MAVHALLDGRLRSTWNAASVGTWCSDIERLRAFGFAAGLRPTLLSPDQKAGETELRERGSGAESLAAGLATLCELALDRADEARRLMDRLQSRITAVLP